MQSIATTSKWKQWEDGLRLPAFLDILTSHFNESSPSPLARKAIQFIETMLDYPLPPYLKTISTFGISSSLESACPTTLLKQLGTLTCVTKQRQVLNLLATAQLTAIQKGELLKELSALPEAIHLQFPVTLLLQLQHQCL